MCDATPTTSGRLSCNDRLAERNRGFFRAKRVFAVHLLACPCSGVQQFVARTQADFGRQRIRVLTPDFLEQIHACPTDRLDAHSVYEALDRLDLDRADIVLLQNPCGPAARTVCDLGETARVAIFSARGGAQLPRKAATLFRNVSLVVINEMHLAASAGFDLAQARKILAKVAPHAQLITVASATGAGMEAWHEFLDAGVEQANA